MLQEGTGLRDGCGHLGEEQWEAAGGWGGQVRSLPDSAVVDGLKPGSPQHPSNNREEEEMRVAGAPLKALTAFGCRRYGSKSPGQGQTWSGGRKMGRKQAGFQAKATRPSALLQRLCQPWAGLFVLSKIPGPDLQWFEFKQTWSSTGTE